LRSKYQAPRCARVRARSGASSRMRLCTDTLLVQLLWPPSLALCRHSSLHARVHLEAWPVQTFHSAPARHTPEHRMKALPY
jgi:hypothetical protein